MDEVIQKNNYSNPYYLKKVPDPRIQLKQKNVKKISK